MICTLVLIFRFALTFSEKTPNHSLIKHDSRCILTHSLFLYEMCLTAFCCWPYLFIQSFFKNSYVIYISDAWRSFPFSDPLKEYLLLLLFSRWIWKYIVDLPRTNEDFPDLSVRFYLGKDFLCCRFNKQCRWVVLCGRHVCCKKGK